MWHPLKTGFSLLFILCTLFPFFLYLIFSNKMILLTWDIIFSPSIPISLSILFDTYGIALIITVIFIASNVIFFTATYIQGDNFIPRFTGLVVSFVFAICLLVIFPNIITLLIGWDGLGLTSYLLVLYYQSPKSHGAATITAITNRLGDVLILFTIAWRINTHWLPISPWSSPSHFLIRSILIIAAITKRAQIPFIRWLPAAMAAPTPVSALVHSSTLVTAGVFILIRFFNFIKNSIPLEIILLFAASLTACIAGLSALTECDIKKIIALSTLRQLGTIIYSLAINIPLIAFFHLITHALFKALLFITAGVLIHFHHHNQDLRSYGHLNSSIPLLTSIALVSNTALCGIPFTAGFYSKDLIIETHISNPISYLLIRVFIFGTSLTACYTIRFLTNLIYTPRHTPPARIFQLKFNILIIAPILILAFGTLITGASLSWILFFPQPEATLPLYLKLQALILAGLGGLIGYFISTQHFINPILIKASILNHFLTSLAFTTPINAQFIARIPLFSGHTIHKSSDGGWIETFGGQGALLTSWNISTKISNLVRKSLPSNLFILAIFSVLLFLI